MIARRWSAALGLTLVSWGMKAHAADTPVALDLQYLAPLSSGSAVDGGSGVGVRIGRRFQKALWLITPELKLGYASFGGAAESRVYQGLAGLRLGHDVLAVRPGLFVHGGVGRASFAPGIGAGPTGPGPDHTAFSYDAGAFVDFTLLPLVNIGAHVSYNQLLQGKSANPGLKWLAVGLQAELVL